VLRIGQELGLEPALVRRAISDVRGQAPAERGIMASVMGPGVVRAARTVRRPAAAVGLLLEEYLQRVEYMVVQRRFPDRTRYVRATGMGAALGRAARKFGASHAALDLPHLEVAVSVIDDDTSLVELTVALNAARAGFAGGGLAVGGTAASGLATIALVTPMVDVIALAGLPLLGGSMWLFRRFYGMTQRSTQDKLESFLDRLQHGELRIPVQRGPWTGGSFPFGGGGSGLKIGRGG